MSNFFRSKKPVVLITILWALLIAAVLLVWLHGNEVYWRRPVPVQAAQPSGHGPYSYIVPMGTDWLSQTDTFDSPALLLEDGRTHGPANALHARIGKLGSGRFSFWKGSLIFSSSDNSDPRTNGRQYTLVLPFKDRLMTWSLVILLTITLIFGFRYFLSILPGMKRHFESYSRAEKVVMKSRMDNFFHSKRFFVLLAILWTISLGAVLWLWFQGDGLSSRVSLQYPVAVQAAQSSGHGPYSFSVPIGTDLLGQTESFPSPAQLYEDGQLLGPGNSQHADIGTQGRGRFSFWKGGLIFSSSDNSDPRTNGRQYTLVLPFKGVLITWGLVILLLITLIFYLIPFLSIPETARNRRLFYLSIMIVVIAFVIPRLPWFVDYPIPSIQPDTYSYFKPLRQIFSGNFPIFDLRTPGYPLFLAFSLAISPYLKFTVILQNLLTLCSALFFVWAVYKTYSKLAICAGIAMVAHVAQPFIVAADFSLVTESLYSSCLVLSIGLLLLAICTQKPTYALLFSILAGFAILVRPSGIFMGGILLLVILYMIVNSYPRKNVLCLALPMPIMFILLFSYNYFSFGSFTLSNLGNGMLYAVTSVYWEPDASFPAEVNRGIQKFKDEIPEADKHVLYTSWDPVKYQPIANPLINKAYWKFPDSGLPVSKIARNKLMTQIALKAMRSHPDMYIKFVWFNLHDFLMDPSSWNIGIYDIPSLIQSMYGAPRLALDEFVSREYATMPSIPAISVIGRQGGELQVKFVSTPLLEIQTQFTTILWSVFDMKAWLTGYFIVLAIGMYMLIHSKFRNRNVFFFFTVSSILLLAGLSMALVTPLSNRYPSPTRFIEVFSIAFIPLLWMKIKAGKLM